MTKSAGGAGRAGRVSGGQMFSRQQPDSEFGVEWALGIESARTRVAKTFYFDTAEWYKKSGYDRGDYAEKKELARLAGIATNQLKYYSSGQVREALNIIQGGQAVRLTFALPQYAREAAQRKDYRVIKGR